MRLVKILVILIAVVIPLSAFAKWTPPTEWTYKASLAKVIGVAKTLPKTLPIKLIKTQKNKLIFKGDWGAMDIPKDAVLDFYPEGKSTKVNVSGCSPNQAYKILREIGDKLKQPLPNPPKKHRY